MSKDIKFIDLFAGIGGFHIALHNLGAKCVFVSEFNQPARETYEANFAKIEPDIFTKENRDKLFAGDITKVEAKAIPDFDILCAGFPCQPFSISGHQKGFNDTRGTLFFDVMRIIKEKKPNIVLLENVKHLKYHDNGKTLKVILENLKKIGYKVDWQVFNAKDFGLAQNRERIIIVASKEKQINLNTVIKLQSKNIKSILEKNNNDFEYLKKSEYTILPESLWKRQVSGLIFCGYRNKSIRTKGVRPNTEHLSRVHKQPNRIYSIDGTHPTIPSQESSGRFWIYDGNKVRKLTIRECYRLQGFPDNFVLNKKLSSSYNQIGNSVAIPMIEAVFTQIKEQLL